MLEVRSLTRIYWLGRVAVNALVDVSFAVLEGHITCIPGKSGE